MVAHDIFIFCPTKRKQVLEILLTTHPHLPRMSFSIYELDENIKKLLTVDNYLNGLSVNDFIEEISKDHFLKVLKSTTRRTLIPSHTSELLKVL